MIEISLDEWAARMFISKRYLVRNIDYDNGVTVVHDSTLNKYYSVTYSRKSRKMELREIDGNGFT